MNGNKLSTIMNKSYIYSAVLSCIAILSGCVDIEEFEEPAQKVSKTFYAEMEESPLTKTVLGDKGEDGIRPVLWMPEDKIGVAPSTGGAFDMFVNKSAESSVMAEFEGQTSLAPSYFAVYPYDKDAVVADGSISFTLNTEQKYKSGSFDEGAFPMIARSSDTNDDGLMFYNLCGVLEVNLTGEENITKISFSSNNKVSGKFSVNANYEQYPEMVPDASSMTSTTLDCGAGVQLKADSPTPFYFVLPPGTYDAFTLMIHTSDGKMMFKQSQKPLTIKRSVIIKSGALAYVESVSVDLSIRGTSNCYVVPGAGMYSFDASVIGNGSYGIISGASFHTEDPKITPASVEVLWESTGAGVETSKGKLLTSVSLIDGRIHFVSTGVEGNALVAVKDNNGTILWSWHIWATDQPMEQQHKNDNGEFYVQDRNIGATRADKGTGEEWRESIGMYYQWGRKDPFIGWNQIPNSNKMSIAASITDPTRFPTSYPWMTPENHELWDSSQKTIYDPCPTGYVITSDTVWDTYKEQNVVHNQNGWEFTYDGVNKTWIPGAAWIDTAGNLINRKYEVYMWSGKHDKNLHILNHNLNVGSWQLNNGFTVRCMKDDNYIDPLYPGLVLKEIGDITSASATVLSTITNNGKGDIISRGVVYGTTPTVTVENGIKVESTDNTSEFTTQISGLQMATKYYVRAFAVNEVGIAYSNPVSFHTIYEGDGIDLSKDGTANSYIVPPVYSAYNFDCTVKGNSTEQVGEAASVEVIWETKNTSEAVSLGEIIPSVELLDGKVKFMLPFEPVHGNALIAVKDAAGKILWSWHVWVTDYDPETDADLYASGAKMMDRNLGALNTTMGDTRSYGFYYQWGRKDPFMTFVSNGENKYVRTYPEDVNVIAESSSTTDINTTIQNPVKIYKNTVNWLTDNSLWGSIKTMYDPCPVGWRIPDGGPGVWEGFEDSPKILSGGVQVIEPLSSPATFYPTIKTLHESGGEDNLTLRTYLWSCTFDNGTDPYVFVCSSYSNGSIQLDNRSNKMAQRLVRCMKDAEIVPEIVSISNITEGSARFAGKLTIKDATVIEEMGFVLSSTNSNMSITNESCTKFTVASTTGDYSVDATGLTPNTIYYVRAYAKGGYNTKYGEVIEFRTHSIGINDDFSDDEYEWE